MRRRDFIKGIVGSATVGPLAVRAQQPEKSIVGMLDAGSAEGDADLLGGFRQALSEAGYVEGQNVAIEYRWAKGQYDLLPALASELVQLRPAVLLAPGLPAALSIKEATSTIPIVFVSGPDPVRSGLVANLNGPNGNITGVTLFTSVLVTKRLCRPPHLSRL